MLPNPLPSFLARDRFLRPPPLSTAIPSLATPLSLLPRPPIARSLAPPSLALAPTLSLPPSLPPLSLPLPPSLLPSHSPGRYSLAAHRMRRKQACGICTRRTFSSMMTNHYFIKGKALQTPIIYSTYS